MSRPVYRLERSQRIPCGRDEVFVFFADAANLEAVTPPFLRFRILSTMPVEMRRGARIEYSLALFGIPFRWRTVITRWEPGICFVDEQEAGRYAFWRHTHWFADDGDATEMKDTVEYALPLGPIGRIARWLFVRRTLERIFSALVQRSDTIVIDKLSHACMIDGTFLARGNFRFFKHNDMNDLEQEAQAPDSALEEGKVFDYITGEPVKDTEKERVRQRIARAIIHEYGIAAEDMEPDFKVKVQGKNRKLDIAIFRPGTEHTADTLYRAVVVEKGPKLGTKGAYRMRDPEEARKEFEGVLESVMAEVASWSARGGRLSTTTTTSGGPSARPSRMRAQPTVSATSRHTTSGTASFGTSGSR